MINKRALAAEDRVFEANMTAEQAMKDAIEADTDAQRFEDLARLYERKCKAALTELEQVKAACTALESQLATGKAAPALGAEAGGNTAVAAPRTASKRRAFATKPAPELVDGSADVECEPVVAFAAVPEVKKAEIAVKPPLVVAPPPSQPAVLVPRAQPQVAMTASKTIRSLLFAN